MKLIDLHPTFYGAADCSGMGILFDCPCGCDEKCGVPFANPISGGEPRDGWQRTGETFETLTLIPSLQRVKSASGHGCDWHGFVTNGEVTTV